MITQNGEVKMVLRDVASYEQAQETMPLLKILALGNRQIEAGKARRIELLTSAPLLKELGGVLGRVQLARQLQVRALSVDAIADGYAAIATVHG